MSPNDGIPFLNVVFIVMTILFFQRLTELWVKYSLEGGGRAIALTEGVLWLKLLTLLLGWELGKWKNLVFKHALVGC